MDDDAFRFGILTQRMNLKPAVQTAKHAEYAKGKGVERTGTFTRWENPSPLLIRSAFAWFAYFAVPSAFSRVKGWLRVSRFLSASVVVYLRFNCRF